MVFIYPSPTKLNHATALATDCLDCLTINSTLTRLVWDRVLASARRRLFNQSVLLLRILFYSICLLLCYYTYYRATEDYPRYYMARVGLLWLAGFPQSVLIPHLILDRIAESSAETSSQ